LDGCSKSYGFTEKATEIENFQTQAPQTNESESAQEALALQGLNAFAPRPSVADCCWFAKRNRRSYNREYEGAKALRFKFAPLDHPRLVDAGIS
jgi:hypothetical protein